LITTSSYHDICGVAAGDDRFIVSTGQGHLELKGKTSKKFDLNWDNHMTASGTTNCVHPSVQT
jgi:hypothetical protein